VTLSNSAFILVPGFGNTGSLENVNSTIQGSGSIGNGIGTLSLLNNAGGRIVANVPGPSNSLVFLGPGGLTNDGTMEAMAGGTLEMPFVGVDNTLTGGTYIVDGTSGASTMNSGGSPFFSPEIVNNAANIILNGTNANVSFVDGAGDQLLRGLVANTTAGSGLTIENGYNLTTPGDFSNAGTVTVGNGSTLKMGPGGTNSYAQSGGTTQGIGTIAGNVTIDGGTVRPGVPNADGGPGMHGTYNHAGGVSVSGGTVKPGDSPGILTINGNYSQSGGTLESELAGLTAGTGYGQLSVSGLATLTGGTLDVDEINGFMAAGGNDFFVLVSTGD
jgi:hypothetical protein